MWKLLSSLSRKNVTTLQTKGMVLREKSWHSARMAVEKCYSFAQDSRQSMRHDSAPGNGIGVRTSWYIACPGDV